MLLLFIIMLGTPLSHLFIEIIPLTSFSSVIALASVYQIHTHINVENKLKIAKPFLLSSMLRKYSTNNLPNMGAFLCSFLSNGVSVF